MRRTERGFGLTELLITLLLLAAVTAAAAPSVLGSLRTYQRSAAARHMLAAIRDTQHLAVTRRDVFGLQWGAGPSLSRPPGEYRVVRDATGTCGFPAVGATEDGSNVVHGWNDISSDYPGVRILSMRDNGGTLLAAVMFDSRGGSVNTCASVSFPVRVTIADADGQTRVIEIRRAGGTRLL